MLIAVRAIGAFMCFATIASAQTNVTPELAAVIEGAKKEGVLLLRSTSPVLGGPEGAKLVKEGIKRQFGVDLEVKWAPGPAYGPLAAILNQERQAGAKASSDAFSATAVQYSPYMDQGLFRRVEWQKLMPGRVTDAIVESDGRLLRHDTSAPAILYNTQEAKWAPGIKTFDDLRAYRRERGDDLLVIAPHPFYPKSHCLGRELEKNIDLFRNNKRAGRNGKLPIACR